MNNCVIYMSYFNALNGLIHCKLIQFKIESDLLCPPRFLVHLYDSFKTFGSVLSIQIENNMIQFIQSLCHIKMNR